MGPKHVNLKYLKEISGGNRELIIEMIQIFESEVPGYLNLMDQYHQNGNWEALGKLCHKAKASASIMGIKQLSDDLKNFEHLLEEEKNAHLYPSILGNIEKQFTEAREELARISKNL